MSEHPAGALFESLRQRGELVSLTWAFGVVAVGLFAVHGLLWVGLVLLAIELVSPYVIWQLLVAAMRSPEAKWPHVVAHRFDVSTMIVKLASVAWVVWSVV